jgi:coatomer subunit beta
LQNCTLELATLGDLKLVEKPQPVVLAPHDFCNIKDNVKVASTENGIIFGNIGEQCYFTILFPVPYKLYV